LSGKNTIYYGFFKGYLLTKVNFNYRASKFDIEMFVAFLDS